MDRYGFTSVTNDVFKDCKTREELMTRYKQLSRILDTLFYKNIYLLKEGAE